MGLGHRDERHRGLSLPQWLDPVDQGRPGSPALQPRVERRLRNLQVGGCFRGSQQSVPEPVDHAPPTGSAGRTQVLRTHALSAAPAVSGLRGAEGTLTAVAGLEGQYGGVLGDRGRRGWGRRRQRRFPEPEGEDARGSGPPGSFRRSAADRPLADKGPASPEDGRRPGTGCLGCGASGLQLAFESGPPRPRTSKRRVQHAPVRTRRRAVRGPLGGPTRRPRASPPR